VALLVTIRGLRSIDYRPAPILARDDSNGPMSPAGSLALERSAALLQCCGTGLGIALILGLVVAVSAGIPTAVACGIAGGLVTGILCGEIKPDWPSYALARSMLALKQQLPWLLMAFLSDARKRGVLRQVGAVYQFSHFDLQQHLARKPIQINHSNTMRGQPSTHQN
jgi:hypothetical protein